MKIKIDELDRKILDVMSRKGVGAKVTVISNELGMSRSTVNLRISKLEKRGIISGYKPKINWKKLGYEFFGLIGIICPDRSMEELLKVLKEGDTVSEVWEIDTGTFDLIIKCKFRMYDDLRKLHEKIVGIQGVRDVDIWLLGPCHKEE
ncbi:MAG: Lrp/AsnC family transcriptional regulator [Candidatus Syntropharchaeia archaeon]